MRTRSWQYLIGLAALLGLALGVPAGAQDGADAGETTAEPAAGRAFLLEVDGPIGPATTDYLERAFEDAAAEGGVGLIVVRLDTPGGLTAATRDIVRAIRSSSVPVAVWVAPEGARAASAGTYILYASHVAAMAPATNVGAATPVSIGGAPAPPSGPEEKPAEKPAEKPEDGGAQDGDGGGAGGEGGTPAAEDDQPEAASDADAKRAKAVNDAAAWIRSLAQETGRNADWAERAVREGVSVTAEEAVAQNVADFIAASLDEVLQQADGRGVEVQGKPRTLATAGLAVERREPDWRSELLSVITNPTVAYLLLMIGIYGLLLEGYSPGSFVPGTVGAISLLLALYAFQVLPVNYAGLLLIVLGIILIVAEAFSPSFGVLGIGGVVAMVAGSIILMDTDVPGFGLPLEVITAVGLFCSVIMLALVTLAVRAWRQPVVSGAEGVAAARGEVIEPVDESGGIVHTLGERWQARSDGPIPAGARVRIISREGLVLHVEVDPEQEE